MRTISRSDRPCASPLCEHMQDTMKSSFCAECRARMDADAEIWLEKTTTEARPYDWDRHGHILIRRKRHART